ncbi:MAG: RNA chaperone Hfq [Thermoanaerobaculia bacterium]|nr:RNA chaperone Hfq [Thermoanaerobaculia bacterium]
MSKHNINIQDGFLFQNLKEATPLRVELTTGRDIQGKLKRFDRFAIVMETEGSEVLVYKHAIAQIGTAS